jgi:hypothetical protein
LVSVGIAGGKRTKSRLYLARRCEEAQALQRVQQQQPHPGLKLRDGAVEPCRQVIAQRQRAQRIAKLCRRRRRQLRQLPQAELRLQRRLPAKIALLLLLLRRRLRPCSLRRPSSKRDNQLCTQCQQIVSAKGSRSRWLLQPHEATI